MKNAITTIFILLFIPISAQQQLPEKELYHSSQDVSITENSSGFILEEMNTSELISDSIIINRQTQSHKYTSTYGSNDELLVHIEEIDTGTGWKLHARQTYSYDVDGSVTSYLQEEWDGTSWQNNIKREYSYGSPGIKDADTLFSWVSGTWVYTSRNLYTYDVNNNMTIYIFQYHSSGGWDNNTKYTYAYDAAGNRVSEITESWFSGAWNPSRRTTYTHDAAGNMLTKLRQDWNGSAYEDDRFYHYTYDDSGNLLTEVLERWSGSAWENYYRRTFTYDSYGNPLTFLYELWDTGAWTNSTRYTYSYNGSGDMTEYLIEGWDNSSSAWISENKLEVTWSPGTVYCNVLTDSSGIWLDYEEGNISFYSKGYLHYFGFGTDGYYYYQTPSSVSCANIQPDAFNLSNNFPNPFNPETKIEFILPFTGKVELVIYNAAGERVTELVNEEMGPGLHSVSFNASDLASGVYFYRIKAGDFIHTKKMVPIK